MASRRFRLVSVLVLAVGVVASTLTSKAIGDVIDEQERRLLEERSSEAALFLEASMNELDLTMTFLARVMQIAPEPQTVFEFIGGGLERSGIEGGGLAEERDGALTILSDLDGASGPVPPEWESLLRRAFVERDLVTGVLPSEGATRVGFAYAPDDESWVIFQDVEFDPSRTLELETGDPFSGLEGAVYAGPEATDANLVLRTSEDIDPGPDAVRQEFEVGSDTWLLVATAGGTAGDSFAAGARWWVLVGGCLLALLAAVLVDVLGRRRAYAMRLVAERTAALEASLAEQARLEQGQRTAREAAEAANRSKSEFLSRMSHELRTPLNAVLGFAQLLELDALEPSQRESVSHILKGGRHLLDLINEVLDITRIETGNFSLSPEPVHAGDVVGDVVDLMRPLAQHHGISMTADEALACPSFVVADAQRLRQILLNLVSNAVKYNRVGGSVTIGCEEVGDDLRITVADTGAGIDAESLPRLFTPFERLGAEHTDIEGTGVGLALSRRLAEVMGGTLDVESVVGRGSRFWIQLPRAADPMPDDAELAPVEPVATGDETPGRKVLYIEDNLSNVRLVERVFEARGGLELMTASQGRMGVDLARQHQPSLVLLDLHLPDINGDEVLRQLQADPVTADIPVVMLSADATLGQTRRLLGAGARAYLTKPLDVRALLEVLDGAMGTAEVGADG